MQYEKRKKACEVLKDIDRNPTNYLIIHYSCESFYDITDGKTPRVTSIAIRSYESGQTDSFSIHKVAERNHISVANIEENYDKLERQMLTEYFEFVKEHKGFKWIHWNMRDINYGFKAIEYRYEVLGGSPVVIEDNCKVDLSRLLIQKYGVKYIGHPRMEKLIQLNHIEPKDYLNGKDEAAAFENKDYIKLHQSTLRKVDVFANLIDRAIQNTLQTNAKWHESYGLSAQGIFEFFRECWWLQLIAWILTLLLGVLLGKFI